MRGRIFREILEETLALYEFRREKNSYRRDCRDVIILMKLQRVGCYDGFFIHYGFYFEKLHSGIEQPTLLNCDYFGSFMTGSEGDFLFSCEIPTEQYRDMLEFNMQKYILPTIQGG